MGYSQKEAADALGLKRRVLQYYEKGERDGEKVSVPKTVRLACYALCCGMSDYHGPEAKPPVGDDPQDREHEDRRERPE